MFSSVVYTRCCSICSLPLVAICIVNPKIILLLYYPGRWYVNRMRQSYLNNLSYYYAVFNGFFNYIRFSVKVKTDNDKSVNNIRNNPVD